MFQTSLPSLLALALATSTFAQSVKPSGPSQPGVSSAPFPLGNGTNPIQGTGTGTGVPIVTGNPSKPTTTTYVYETTEYFTITACPPSITNCPYSTKPVTASMVGTTTGITPPQVTPGSGSSTKSGSSSKSTATVTVYAGAPTATVTVANVCPTVCPGGSAPGFAPGQSSKTTIGSGSAPGSGAKSTAGSSSPQSSGSNNNGAPGVSTKPAAVSTVTVVPVVVPTPNTSTRGPFGGSSTYTYSNGTSTMAGPTGTGPVGTAPGSTVPCTTITQTRTIPITTITLGPGSTTTPCSTITETLTIPITTIIGTAPVSKASGTGVSSSSTDAPVITSSTAVLNGTLASSTFRRVRV